jgi:hypothetical protein
MNPENEAGSHTEWIEQYLLGELSGAELEQFEHRLRTEPAFEREVRLQRSIMMQAEQVGREDLRRQLKTMHRQFGFVRKDKKHLSFRFYAIAASITLLVVAGCIYYVFYLHRFADHRTPIASSANHSLPSPTFIRYQVTGGGPNMGFSGAQTDSTVAILIETGRPGPPFYQFDDTLHLFGPFAPNRLTLQYDPAKEQYTLLEGSLSYPLQRYRPMQVLKAAP